MVHRRKRRPSPLSRAVIDRNWAAEVARTGRYLGLVLVILPICQVSARAQLNPSGEIPVNLLSDHIVREGEDVFFSTAYPISVVDGDKKGKIAQAGSFLRCKAAARTKNSMSLTSCEMFFQPVDEKDATYKCVLPGKALSVRWRHRLFWDQLVNAGETWQGAVGSFAIGSTAALFTNSHTILGVGTAVGFLLTGVGPLAKHHPAWFLPSNHSALPDTRTLLFAPGQSPLEVTKMECVGGCDPKGGKAKEDPSSQSGKKPETTEPQ